MRYTAPLSWTTVVTFLMLSAVAQSQTVVPRLTLTDLSAANPKSIRFTSLDSTVLENERRVIGVVSGVALTQVSLWPPNASPRIFEAGEKFQFSFSSFKPRSSHLLRAIEHDGSEQIFEFNLDADGIDKQNEAPQPTQNLASAPVPTPEPALPPELPQKVAKVPEEPKPRSPLEDCRWARSKNQLENITRRELLADFPPEKNGVFAKGPVVQPAEPYGPDQFKLTWSEDEDEIRKFIWSVPTDKFDQEKLKVVTRVDNQDQEVSLTALNINHENTSFFGGEIPKSVRKFRLCHNIDLYRICSPQFVLQEEKFVAEEGEQLTKRSIKLASGSILQYDFKASAPRLNLVDVVYDPRKRKLLLEGTGAKPINTTQEERVYGKMRWTSEVDPQFLFLPFKEVNGLQVGYNIEIKSCPPSIAERIMLNQERPLRSVGLREEFEVAGPGKLQPIEDNSSYYQVQSISQNGKMKKSIVFESTQTGSQPYVHFTQSTKLGERVSQFEIQKLQPYHLESALSGVRTGTGATAAFWELSAERLVSFNSFILIPYVAYGRSTVLSGRMSSDFMTTTQFGVRTTLPSGPLRQRSSWVASAGYEDTTILQYEASGAGVSISRQQDLSSFARGLRHLLPSLLRPNWMDFTVGAILPSFSYYAEGSILSEPSDYIRLRGSLRYTTIKNGDGRTISALLPFGGLNIYF